MIGNVWEWCQDWTTEITTVIALLTIQKVLLCAGAALLVAAADKKQEGTQVGFGHRDGGVSEQPRPRYGGVLCTFVFLDDLPVQQKRQTHF